ncbi:MAG: ribonucleotide reductase assembly protein NrdI [Bacillus thermozeamaize]|uniref:Protein NrdI n=1 Tax=Bacillus thermozeamaize TaxID=230954 RepID=A0A1Y3PJ30_9BACI|nr:MAG: ribonucleotide reductase assembly protein NrdI [Bacillus thermozeamaize]
MQVVYASRTGNVRRFIRKLHMDVVAINDDEMIVDYPFVLVTYTDGFGQVPKKVLTFLERNHRHLVAVAASGNRNWGRLFAHSADVIAQTYGVPILLKFELSGTDEDVKQFKERVDALWPVGILN